MHLNAGMKIDNDTNFGMKTACHSPALKILTNIYDGARFFVEINNGFLQKISTKDVWLGPKDASVSMVNSRN